MIYNIEDFIESVGVDLEFQSVLALRTCNKRLYLNLKESNFSYRTLQLIINIYTTASLICIDEDAYIFSNITTLYFISKGYSVSMLSID